MKSNIIDFANNLKQYIKQEYDVYLIIGDMHTMYSNNKIVTDLYIQIVPMGNKDVYYMTIKPETEEEEVYNFINKGLKMLGKI